MSLLSEGEAKGILSKGMYWREVARRELKGAILGAELAGEIERMGTEKILMIILEYAENSLDIKNAAT